MQDNKLIKALVLNAQFGNNSAFEQLYQITIEPIYALILRLTGDPSSAEMLTKKTYVNSWETISQKDEFASFEGWVKKIAIKTVLEETSKDRLTAQSNFEAKQNMNEIEQNFFKSNPIERFIQGLEFREKFVYILHDIENLSYDEISKLMNLSIKDTKSFLIKARENLIAFTEV